MGMIIWEKAKQLVLHFLFCNTEHRPVLSRALRSDGTSYDVAHCNKCGPDSRCTYWKK